MHNREVAYEAKSSCVSILDMEDIDKTVNPTIISFINLFFIYAFLLHNKVITFCSNKEKLTVLFK